MNTCSEFIEKSPSFLQTRKLKVPSTLEGRVSAAAMLPCRAILSAVFNKPVGEGKPLFSRQKLHKVTLYLHGILV